MPERDLLSDVKMALESIRLPWPEMMSDCSQVPSDYLTDVAPADTDALYTVMNAAPALVAENEQLTKERDAQRERADREMRTRISQGNDLIRQRDAAQKDQIEIRELLGCTEDDDDYIGALRRVVSDLATAKRLIEHTVEGMDCLPGCDHLAHEELCPVANPAAAWAQLRAEVARLRKVTGGDCPKCGRTLKTEHEVRDQYPPARYRQSHDPWQNCITVADLIANYPEIAREISTDPEGTRN